MIAATVAINLLVLAVPLYINRIYTAVLPQKAGDSLVVITVLLLAVLVVDVLIKAGRAWVLSWMGAAEEHKLRMQAIRALLAAPLSVSQSAPIEDRLWQVRAVTQLRSLFEQQWLVRRVDVPFAIVYLVVLALIGGWLVLVPLALAPLFVWQASKASARMGGALQHKQRAESFRNEAVLACLQGAPTVKALNLEGFLVRRLEPVHEAYSKALCQQEATTARLQNLSQLFAQCSQLLIVSVGGWFVINQNLSSGALAACTLLSGQVTMPLSKLFTAGAQLAGLELAQQQLSALHELPVEDHLLAGEPVPAGGTLSTGNLSLNPGEVGLISGGRPHQSTALLESLSALAGSMPTDLLLDGRSAQAMERVALRQQLRLVRHGAPLLGGTVLDHLTQFRADALGARAIALCTRHGVGAQILRLPRGYDTRIGDNQDFPLPAGLVFRLQVIQALLDQPAVLMVDASGVLLPSESLTWFLGLELQACRLVALLAPPPQPLPPAVRRFSWSADQLVEVRR